MPCVRGTSRSTTNIVITLSQHRRRAHTRRSTPKSSRLGASRWSSRPAGCSSPPTLAPVSRPPHSQGAQRLGMPIPSVRIVAKPIYVSAAFSRIGGPGVGRGSRPWSMFVRFVAKIYVSPPPRSLIGGPGMGRAMQPTPPKCQDCRQTNLRISLKTSRLGSRGQPAQR